MMNAYGRTMLLGIISFLAIFSVYAETNDTVGYEKGIVELYSAPLLFDGKSFGGSFAGIGCQHLNRTTRTLEVKIEVIDEDGDFVAGGQDTLFKGASGVNIFYVHPGPTFDTLVCKWTYSGKESGLRAIAVSYRVEMDEDGITHIPLITVEGSD